MIMSGLRQMRRRPLSKDVGTFSLNGNSAPGGKKTRVARAKVPCNEKFPAKATCTKGALLANGAYEAAQGALNRDARRLT